jgi:hypothetical protein
LYHPEGYWLSIIEHFSAAYASVLPLFADLAELSSMELATLEVKLHNNAVRPLALFNAVLSKGHIHSTPQLSGLASMHCISLVQWERVCEGRGLKRVRWGRGE